MKKNLIYLFVFIIISFSRFIPHSPNFNIVLALSFYVPAILGQRYILVLLLSYIFTDIIIGLHDTIYWTWSSVLIINFLAIKLKNTFSYRVIGSILGAIIFFVVTNFGFWTTGAYGLTAEGLVTSYLMAIPFFSNSLVSTIFYACIFEGLIKINFINKYLKINFNQRSY